VTGTPNWATAESHGRDARDLLASGLQAIGRHVDEVRHLLGDDNLGLLGEIEAHGRKFNLLVNALLSEVEDRARRQSRKADDELV
jgi:hypothetical protein